MLLELRVDWHITFLNKYSGHHFPTLKSLQQNKNRVALCNLYYLSVNFLGLDVSHKGNGADREWIS